MTLRGAVPLGAELPRDPLVPRPVALGLAGLLALALAVDSLWISWVAHGASNALARSAPGLAALDAFRLDAVATCVALAAMVPLWWHQSRAGTTGAPAGVLKTMTAGAGIGLLVFVRIIGMRLAVPTEVDWIAAGDWTQHYAGWEFFRRDAWRWPPGAMHNLAHPVGTSLVYTDSMPLLGLLLKPFHAWLPAQFQYIGAVLLLAWVLQGAMAALLARAAGHGAVAAMCCAALLVQLPVLMLRTGHDTLTWQWLLLAALALYLAVARRAMSSPRQLQYWTALCALASLVHPYLAAMVLAVLLACTVLQVRRHDTSRRAATLQVGAGIATVLVGWLLSGAFVLTSAGSLAGVEMGEYSANLLALFDGAGASRWIPTLPVATAGQYEGSAWPGLGVAALLLGGAALSLRAYCRRRNQAAPSADTLAAIADTACATTPAAMAYAAARATATGPATATAHAASRAWRPLLLLMGAAFVFAVSLKITVGSTVLVDLSQFTPRLLEAFHASGRFVWLTLYGAVAIALATLARAPRAATWLLLAAALLQTLEYRPWQQGRAADRAIAHAGTLQPLPARWDALAQGRAHLVAVPARGCGAEPLDWFSLARLALRHDLTLNSAYLARFDGKALRAACANVVTDLATGRVRADTLYVLSESAVRALPSVAAARLHCLTMRGVAACVSAAPGMGPG